MSNDKIGRIVWHDLFTTNRQGAMAFYQRVAGWAYQVEHATDFAWGGGERDFVLALSGDEAGAGLVEAPPELRSGWVAYVEVPDVDATAARAEALGGVVERQPFEVPGVGRNALLRDPFGALIGIALSRHDYPAPRRQFGIEVYLSDTPSLPQAFYAQLFDWKLVSAPSGSPGGDVVAGPSGEPVAVHLAAKPRNGELAAWIPSLKVINPEDALRRAEQLGARPSSDMPLKVPQHHNAIFYDPDGAPFCLLDAA